MYKWDYQVEKYEDISTIGEFTNYDIIWRRLKDGTVEMSPDNQPLWEDQK